MHINIQIVILFILVTSTFAVADVRNNAISVISALRDTGAVQKMPDEIQSMDATFITAEKFYQLNDPKNAEPYYLLTIQKALVLAAMMLDQSAEKTIPGKELQFDSTVPPDISTLPQPLPTIQSDPVIQPAPPADLQSPTEMIKTAPDGYSAYFSDEAISESLVGNISTYIVRKNDSIRLVAAKLGVSRQHLAQINHIDPKSMLLIGQKLKYNNRKIVPQRMKNGIVINIPDRTLYYFKQGKLAVTVPVALGSANKYEKYDWKTPTGKFKITAKQKDPIWYVPTSIQSEMQDEGKEVVASVPPGPNNPLGKYAIKTSLPGILIHSTTKPGSIYSFASHGCIRVNPEHMEDLFKDIRINTLGEIIYRPVKLAVTGEGRIFMEVHQDAYGKNIGLDAEARRLIEKMNLSDQVNWKKVRSMIKLKSGIAEDVTL